MKLFDTAKKQYVTFEPPQTVKMYTCGITPYDSAHLGHVLTFMTYDLLQRFLEDQEHEVRLVRNVTDVDEPIFAKAKLLGIPYTELAATETAGFQAILTALNFRPAFAEPLASDYVSQMSQAVEKLLANSYAYRLEDDVYFAVDQFNEFGRFSGFSDRLQHAFMSQRGGDPDRSGKRNPLDFLLWRGVRDLHDLAAWESPLGRGRPGWHIECSVMADSLLGTPFDLHGGGSDLIFPHHECEIAQSYGLGQPLLARTWMHVAPLSYCGEKMSKSLGNLVFAKDLLGSYEPAAIRLALMHYHYRVGGEWLPELLDEATVVLKRLRTLAPKVSRTTAEGLLAAIRSGLADDLDMHAINHALNDLCLHAETQPTDHDGDAAFQVSLQLLGLG